MDRPPPPPPRGSIRPPPPPAPRTSGVNRSYSFAFPRGFPGLVLAATMSMATFAVYYSHNQQVVDRATMREGVLRDKERIRSSRRMKRRMGEGNDENGE